MTTPLSTLILAGTLCFAAWMLPLIGGEEWSNGPAAQVVIGQPGFDENTPGDGDSTFNSPWDVAVDPTTGKVFVADTSNNRVLRFASFTQLSNGDAAEAVFGQVNMDPGSNVADVGQDKLDNPTAVLVDSSGRLWVSDAGNNRVLRFDGASELGSGALADGVLGQENFMDSGNAVTQKNFYSPRGLAMDDAGNLFVADPGNSRVLMFSDAANLNDGDLAALVFGQEDFTSPGVGFDRDGFYIPGGVAVDANGTLWVADGSNNRVLRFDNAASKSNGADADGVLGQDAFVMATGSGAMQGEFNGPQDLVVDSEGTLWVAEFTNKRIQGFANAATLDDGALSDYVIGQPDFDTFNTDPNAETTSVLRGIALDSSGRIYVADFGFDRVAVFEKDRYLPDFTVGEKAAKQIGAGVYNSSGSGQKKSVRTDNKKVKFISYLENDGNVPDSFSIQSRKTNSKFQIKVFQLSGGKVNVTAGAKTGTHVSPEVVGGGKLQYNLEVKPKKKIKEKRANINAWLQGKSTYDSEIDRVIGRVKNRP